MIFLVVEMYLGYAIQLYLLLAFFPLKLWKITVDFLETFAWKDFGTFSPVAW